jgi:hypothetical protein
VNDAYFVTIARLCDIPIPKKNASHEPGHVSFSPLRGAYGHWQQRNSSCMSDETPQAKPCPVTGENDFQQVRTSDRPWCSIWSRRGMCGVEGMLAGVANMRCGSALGIGFANR